MRANAPRGRLTVLVVGGGGREHALAWKLAQSPRVARVLVAPGNAGTAREPGVENVPVRAEDIEGLIALARERSVDLTVVGPEASLVAGIADRFAAQGLRIFGPSAAAARLEGSKAFTKAFLAGHGIPTARYAEFTDPATAAAHVRTQDAPIVIKADGLAAGKGVVVAQSEAEALAAVHDMLSGQAFGDAGRRIVIEECLTGEEASFICVVGGGEAMPLASSQDHKAAGEGDTGPNTGGMGAYSPAPVVDETVHARIMREIIHPTVEGLAAAGTPYTGFLYAGLMIDGDGAPRVIEFNCRLGDPETQPLLLRLRSDLLDLVEAALDGELPKVHPEWDARTALGVVMAAAGYPGRYDKGHPITGLDADMPHTRVFHAGTAGDGDRIVTAGGRVLCVCGLGEGVAEAQRRTLDRVSTIDWPGAWHRRDIGHRALARDRSP
ncbi:MAG: phosphoribosylamine--glycine ligase [Thiotrichales bacterium]|nr:phosphoribosylamine--glycine ligase [Thiotrichales bacterium]